MSELQKYRLVMYNENIDDVALEISQSTYWRKLLFTNNYNQKFLINSVSSSNIPSYIKPLIFDYNLQFYVSKVSECPETFDEGSIVFKFESVEFPCIVRYSGN